MHEPLSIFGPFIRLSLSNFAGPAFTAVHGQREEVCLLMSERPLCGRLSLPESSLQKEEGRPGVLSALRGTLYDLYLYVYVYVYV